MERTHIPIIAGMAKLFTAGGAVVLAVIVAAPAQADESAYLETLDLAGVPYGSPEVVVDLGNSICTSMRKDHVFADVAHVGPGQEPSIWIDNTRYSAVHAGQLVHAAQTYLCPDVNDQVDPIGSQPPTENPSP